MRYKNGGAKTARAHGITTVSVELKPLQRHCERFNRYASSADHGEAEQYESLHLEECSDVGSSGSQAITRRSERKCHESQDSEGLCLRRGDCTISKSSEARGNTTGFKYYNPSNALLSHPLELVPSALEGLTTLFGMGRGVAPADRG